MWIIQGLALEMQVDINNANCLSCENQENKKRKECSQLFRASPEDRALMFCRLGQGKVGRSLHRLSQDGCTGLWSSQAVSECGSPGIRGLAGTS